MANWKRTWDFRAVITDNDGDPNGAARDIVTCLKKCINSDEVDVMEPIIEQFESIRDDPSATVQHFDTVLSELYDYCDDNLIWVKLIG